MGPSDQAIISWLNALMALTAAGVNLAAALRPGPFGQWAPLRAAIAFLAFVYGVAYALLAAGIVPLSRWSPVMRGVSLVAWPLVWIAPAVVSWSVWFRATRQAKGHIESIRAAAHAD